MKKRVQAVRERLNRIPYRYEAIDNAYARFIEDGTLPEDDALAWRALKRVLHARKPVPEMEAERRALTASGLCQPSGSTREMLFREACCSLKPARGLARFMLKAVVEAGHDPTDPASIGPELEPADFASIGMQLLGWPHGYVRPEYQNQLERVLEQQAIVRADRPRNSDEWDRGAGEALSAFLRHGMVPSDSRYYQFVLSTAEMFSLNAHYFGHGDEDLIAAFDSVANADGSQREAALAHLGAVQARSAEVG